MCGFFYSNDESGFKKVIGSESLRAKVSTRGPDSTKIVSNCEERYHVMFSRLALSGKPDFGKQPLSFNKAGRKHLLLFNGEIYNFLSLAKKYKISVTPGFGDTEILVRLFEILPIKTVFSHLKGMYSICIIELKTGIVYLSRDFFGKLPLFYSIGDGGTIAVSSVPSLAAVSTGDTHLNEQSVISYFVSGYVEPGKTIFNSVSAVLPNEFLIFKNGKLCERTILSRKIENNSSSLTAAVQHAVDRRLITERKISVFYSYGMDSSIIKKVVCDSVGEDLDTYTAFFNEKDSTDGCLITLDEYKSETQNIMQLIDDPIFDPATTVLSLLCKKMSDDTKIIFSGDGADEFDGGYAWYGRYELLRMLRLLPIWSRLTRFMPRRLRDLLTCADNELGQILRAQVSAKLFAGLSNHLSSSHPLGQPFDDLRKYDLKIFLPQTMLRKNDIAGSVNGKEIRTPFLDEDLFWQFYTDKLGKHQVKKTYKQLFGVKPQKKQGFDLPLDYWKFCGKEDLEDFLKLWQKLISKDLNPCKLILKSHSELSGGKYIDLKIYQLVSWLRVWEKNCE